jgi:hypothetical protein
MVICPLCEHQQPFGFECDQCGKDLSGLAGLEGLGPPPPNVVAVEGLDATVGPRVGDVPIERVAELEVTSFGAVQVALDVTPEMDTGRAAAVGEVAIERVADLSLDRAPDDGVRTAAPTGVQRCRYCGNTEARGSVCDKCGFRLPRVAALEVGVIVAGEAVKTRCRMCGAPATAGEKCGDCGRDVPFPDA